MPNYRRARVPGGSFFFTVVTDCRVPLFRDAEARRLLGGCFRDCLAKWPFTLNAVVLLPDHLHAIWSLPPGDAEYSKRWNFIKKEFTKRWLASGGRETEISDARRREHRRGVWQPRFWEHTLDDDDDFDRHFDYLHYNPVKHGYVRCPHAWPPSSFHRWVRAGVYPANWACRDDGRVLSFDDIAASVGECRRSGSRLTRTAELLLRRAESETGGGGGGGGDPETAGVRAAVCHAHVAQQREHASGLEAMTSSNSIGRPQGPSHARPAARCGHGTRKHATSPGRPILPARRCERRSASRSVRRVALAVS